MQLAVQKIGGKFQRLSDDVESIKKLQDGRYIIDIHNADPRTTAQNRYYWVMLAIIAQDTGHSKEELHEVFKMMFLNPDENGNYTTTTATVSQFTSYVDKIAQRCADNNYLIPQL